jgi:hypothetical protein
LQPTSSTIHSHTTLFKVRGQGGRTVAGQRSESFREEHDNLRPLRQQTRTLDKMGFEHNPLTGPHTTIRTSATPFLYSIDRSYLCFDIAVEKLIRSPSHWIKDGLQWSENCQVRGIINVSTSFDGQVSVACICCSPAKQFSVFLHLHKLTAKQYSSHTFSQEFQCFPSADHFYFRCGLLGFISET